MSTKLIAAIVAVFLIISTATYIITRERQDAADEALEGVRKNNEKAGQAAEGGALEYDDCRRAGRVWDFGNDRCGRNAPNNGN